MYSRPQLQARKPARRTSQTMKFPAPSGGWIANDNLDSPQSQNGAFVLDNFFPTAQTVIPRKGSDIYATLGSGDLPVTALFDYNNGNIKRLFGSTATTVYDITNVISPINYQLVTDLDDEIVDDLGNNIGQLSTGGLEVIQGMTGGNWITTQFSTTGGTYLVAVNGQDTMQIFDGEYWFPIDQDDVYQLMFDNVVTPFQVGDTITGGTSGATAYVLHIEGSTMYITDVAGTFEEDETITSANGEADIAVAPTPYYVGITGVNTNVFSYVWSYKNRLFFIERDSFNVWYLPVDSISGAAEVFRMGAEFSEGGKLLIGSNWSLDTSGDGGLSEQCVFISDEGQVVAYQGLSPEPDQGWSRVGGYKIGKPLGPLAWMRAGGDLLIDTDIGKIPLSQAVNRDLAALAPSAVSYPIETAWNSAVDARRGSNWCCTIWPEQQMVVVALPTTLNDPPTCFIANARTGAWARFTGWDAKCLCVYDGRLFFGSEGGKVIEAYVTGLDEGAPFTAVCVPQFLDMGSSGARKISTIARAVIRGSNKVEDQVTVQSDYRVRLPSPPVAAPISTDSVWGGAIWGQSQWGGVAEKDTQTDWRSAGASGYALAPALQITSGSIVPLDNELIRLEILYNVGELVS